MAMILLNVTEIKSTACNLWAPGLWNWKKKCPTLTLSILSCIFHFSERKHITFVMLMHIICNKMEQMEENKEIPVIKHWNYYCISQSIKTAHSQNYSLHQTADPCQEGEIYYTPHTWKGKVGLVHRCFPFHS